MSGRQNRKTRADAKSTASTNYTNQAAANMNTREQRPFGAAERSASAYPTLNESMKSLRVDTGTEAKTVRSQSVRQVNHRQQLCSAVPESAVLTPVSRPDVGGSQGRKIHVYTNHFSVNIADATIYQYDIELMMIDRSGKSHAARKNARWDIMQTILREQKNFPVVWYDEGKTLYAREILPEVKLPIQIRMEQDNEKKIFHLTKLNLVRQDRIQNLQNFVQNKTNIRPREIVRIIETLFKQSARKDLVCIRNQFYDRHRQLTNLNDGRGIAKGFYQSLFLTQIGPTININLSFACFYMPLNFVDFACEFLRKDITKDFAEWEIKKFEKMIRNLSIETMHTGRRIFYRIREFGRSANDITFARTNEELAGATELKEISVADYFALKHKRKLMFPYLPCINASKGNQNQPNWLPMEVVRVVEWQRAIKPLDKSQRGAVTKNTIIKPEERYEEIMKIVRNNQYNRDAYLKELNVHVDDQEMLKIEARVLAPPEIKYRRRGQGEAIEYVKCGQWRIRNWFYATTRINSWGIIYFGDRLDKYVDDILQQFKYQLPNLLQRNGFVIDREPSLTTKYPTESDIHDALVDASKKGWSLAVIVLNSDNSDGVYSLVKSCANQQIGLMTQCVNFQALERNIANLNMYVENISQKINGKLGGINGVINSKAALYHSSRDDLFMFFGADVTHSTCSSDRPSIAAVVGSRDLTNSRYAARLCEQYPKKGRCSVEIIKELDTMVVDLLHVFAKSCGNRLPNKIVFYRDGVDEGHYQKVLDNEVNKIMAACRTVYGNKALPQLTFIVVKKRHNTRFFVYDGGQTMNVQEGTVIDTGIIHPSQFDFYLCSQAARMGTSRPALYHVLHDKIGFTSDAIQQLTYWLCHTDMRCTKSVSIPAPVHYAHLAAYGSRVLNFGEDHDRDSLNEDNEEPEQYSLDDIRTKLMELNEKVADDMWFFVTSEACAPLSVFYDSFDTYLEAIFTALCPSIMMVILSYFLLKSVRGVIQRQIFPVNNGAVVNVAHRSALQQMDSRLTLMLLLQSIIAIITYVPFAIELIYLNVTQNCSKSSLRLAQEKVLVEYQQQK
ncbi:unnamed protein product [Rotaria socialis]|uniref:Uncharacterized protein n=1 Tax=Rotaria socialis TaxID=392032 RepID=A0A821BAA8_9BILA|nr:unnamed protein product [Rotaria socialis]CAF4589557.1 unnamed protein product [Rotaria socialis]